MKNKKISRTLFISFILICLVSALAVPQAVFAASYKTNIKKLVNQMNSAEMSVLTTKSIDNTKLINVKLTKDRKARFSALSLKVSEADGLEKGYFGGFVTYRILNSRLKKASLNIFGASLSKANIKTRTPDTYFCDVYRTSDGPVIYRTDGETELDYVIRGISVKKSGNTYKVTKNIYFGYWGGAWAGTANYKVFYTVKKNSKSLYGYVITGMKIKPV